MTQKLILIYLILYFHTIILALDISTTDCIYLIDTQMKLNNLDLLIECYNFNNK